ncbi:hypothetical protein ACE01N_19830 [Saccharicrinis sp. FJH2]|uniref:hypothetical protein n=1 Tax=Saccharicrinis sp. FJH65 TaxID=3344659 RepID=UPI0035F46F6A
MIRFKQIIYLVLISISTASWSQDNKELIRQYDAYVKSINEDSTLIMIDFDGNKYLNPELKKLGKQELYGFYKNGQLVKIRARRDIGSAHGEKLYYLRNDSLIFVHNISEFQKYDYNTMSLSPDELEIGSEGFNYFKNDKIIYYKRTGFDFANENLTDEQREKNYTRDIYQLKQIMKK